jgi:hypothetical protein
VDYPQARCGLRMVSFSSIYLPDVKPFQVNTITFIRRLAQVDFLNLCNLIRRTFACCRRSPDHTTQARSETGLSGAKVLIRWIPAYAGMTVKSGLLYIPLILGFDFDNA